MTCRMFCNDNVDVTDSHMIDSGHIKRYAANFFQNILQVTVMMQACYLHSSYCATSVDLEPQETIDTTIGVSKRLLNHFC